MRSAAGRRETAAEAVGAVRAIRRHELLRIVMADLVGNLDLAGVGAALTDLTGATIQVALEAATKEVEAREGVPIGGDVLVVGMGSLGGARARLRLRRRRHVRAPSRTRASMRRTSQARATLVVQELRRLLSGSGPDPALGLDADLRPEGKSGPLVRSLDAYRTYYERWALTWEFQALLRASPIAGPRPLADAFRELIDPLRWPEGGIDARQVREIRTLKARVESRATAARSRPAHPRQARTRRSHRRRVGRPAAPARVRP